MDSFGRLLVGEIRRRAAMRTNVARVFLIAPAAALLGVFVLGLIVLASVFAVVAIENAGGCGTTVPVGAPASTKESPAQVVQYFESQGVTGSGSAGIEGNLEQESGLNPKEAGGYLAQWGGKRQTDMISWTTKQGYPGDSSDPKVAMTGQLMYIVYDLRTKYATLLSELNSAPDPATAATMFETVYELCRGVVGYMLVTPGSLCNDPARRSNATAALASAGGGTGSTAGATGGTCVGLGGAGGDPIPGFTPGRDDMGVDACAKPGMPIYAPADSTLVASPANTPGFVSWYNGQPLLLFKFTLPLAGTYKGDQYWYVAEQIVPATTVVGTTFAAGQPVARFAASGSCIEIGWGSMTTGSGTLVPTDAHPPSGALTPEAEAFKVFFHLPWVGRSP